MRMNIAFVLNGERRRVEVRPSEVLLEVLRDRLGLKSPKCGCGRGDCGTCTVWINGRSVRSCLVLAVEVDGQEVTTLEGLMHRGPTALQEALIRRNAFQCGFCAPGMVMAATELLRRNPSPCRHEIQEAIAGNLCRCTGYAPIIDTIAEVRHAGSEEGKAP